MGLRGPAGKPADELKLSGTFRTDRHGGRVTVTSDPNEAVAGADAVYTCAWTAADSVPNPLVYQVHPGLMKRAKPRAVFLHCLPARRGQEVSRHVIDGDRSLVWEQVANRVPMLQAILQALVGTP